MGNIQKTSSDPAEVIPGSKIIIICSPSHVSLDILKTISPFVDPDSLIGCIYGGGCFDLQAQSVLGSKIGESGITIFGMQFVPFLCKATKYGQEAEIYGPKNYLCATAYPLSKIDKITQLVSYLWATPCAAIPNFLSLTLTPSNQIIHPGWVYGYFRDWDGKKGYDPKTLPRLYG